MDASKKESPRLFGDLAWSRQLQPDEALFWQGDQPTALYQVRDGFVKLTSVNSRGRETINDFMFVGDLFDLPSFLEGAPYPFSCRASSRHGAQVAVLSRGGYLEDPGLGQRCRDRLFQQLRARRGAPIAYPSDRVEVRLSRALLYLSELLGHPTAAGMRIPWNITRQELAEWIGTSTESVTRLCSQWKRSSLLKRDRRSLTLTDPQQLAALGGLLAN